MPKTPRKAGGERSRKKQRGFDGSSGKGTPKGGPKGEATPKKHSTSPCATKVKAAPTVKLQVHRSRSIPQTPSSVRALAFNATGTRLAVARGDGAIELWVPRPQVVGVAVAGGWMMVAAYAGSASGSTAVVAWTKTGAHATERLFACGHHGKVWEMDFPSFSPKNLRDSHGGSVWSMGVNPTETHLAVGCEDGCVRLMDIGGGGLEYSRSLAASDGRVLSLAWHPSQPALFTGSATGIIRGWDLSGASPKPSIRITCEQYGPDASLVWSLAVLPDYSVVSGMSTGHVQVWDGRMGTLTHSFNSHTADVLGVAAAPEQCLPRPGAATVFSASVDGKVAAFTRVDGKWIVAGSHRGHTHDVRAVAVSSTGVVASGGVDCVLCVTAVEDAHGHRPPTKMQPMPPRPTVCVAPAARAVAVHNGTHVGVFKYPPGVSADILADGSRFESGPTGPIVAHYTAKKVALPAPTAKPQQVFNLKVGGGSSNVVSVALSKDADWLAFSTLTAVFLYHLESDPEGNAVPSRVRISKHAKLGRVVALQFAADGRLVAASHDGTIHLVAVATADGKHTASVAASVGPPSLADAFFEDDGATTPGTPAPPRPLVPKKSKHRARQAPPSGSDAVALPARLQAVCALAVNATSTLAAVALNGTDTVVNVYDLATPGFKVQLPRPDAPITSVSFHPDGATVVVTCANNRFWLFDATTGSMRDWTSDYGESLPADFLRKAASDPVFTTCINPAHPNHLLLVARRYMCNVVVGKPPRAGLKRSDLSAAAGAGSDTSVTNFRYVNAYENVLHAEFLGPDELLVVEVPWLHVLMELPPPVLRHRFGT